MRSRPAVEFVRGVILCGFLLLAACGQGGDLVLPDNKPATPAPVATPPAAPATDAGVPPPQSPAPATVPPPDDKKNDEPR